MVGHTRNVNSNKHAGKINTHASQLNFDLISLFYKLNSGNEKFPLIYLEKIILISMNCLLRLQ